jgi:ATP-dependent Clp protease ATP-binding subunit ClpB
MTYKNFTQKAQEAIQSAQALALEYGSPQIEQAHLLAVLLEQEDGLIPQLVRAWGLTPQV